MGRPIGLPLINYVKSCPWGTTEIVFTERDFREKNQVLKSSSVDAYPIWGNKKIRWVSRYII